MCSVDTPHIVVRPSAHALMSAYSLLSNGVMNARRSVCPSICMHCLIYYFSGSVIGVRQIAIGRERYTHEFALFVMPHCLQLHGQY